MRITIAIAVCFAGTLLGQPIISGNAVALRDTSGNAIATTTSAPSGSERGLIVWPIVSNQSVNITQIGGTTAAGGGAGGTLGIGGTAANNVAINQNPLLIGVEALSSQPAAATTGNQRRLVGTLDGALYVRAGGPITWSCGLNSIAATLTQCQAAPASGLSLYVTDFFVQTTTITSGTFALQQGTGSNCGTGTAALFPVSGTANRFNAPVTTSSVASIGFLSPLKLTAANALCLIGVATNTISAQISGFTAP